MFSSTIHTQPVLFPSQPFLASKHTGFFFQELQSFGDSFPFQIEVQNTKYELNSLVMKEKSRASVYISHFQTLQSCIQWNKAALLFHFQKGLLARLIKQLAVGGHKTTLLQQLINWVIELDNGYHDKNCPWQNNHGPSTLARRVDNYSKQNTRNPKPSKPTPTSNSDSKGKTFSKTPKFLDKETGMLRNEERLQREKNGLCMYCGGKNNVDSCAQRLAREAAKQSKN